MSDETERGPCIREERASREALNKVGDERPLPDGIGVSWCGRRLGGWSFQSADHALLSMKYNIARTPCDACLRAIRRTLGADPVTASVGGQRVIAASRAMLKECDRLESEFGNLAPQFTPGDVRKVLEPAFYRLDELEETATNCRHVMLGAAPVMLSVFALVADEADIDGIREIARWYSDSNPTYHLMWTDYERMRRERGI